MYINTCEMCGHLSLPQSSVTCLLCNKHCYKFTGPKTLFENKPFVSCNLGNLIIRYKILENKPLYRMI